MSLEYKILKDRAYMLKKVRSFFYKKNILEVDVPMLAKKAPIDAYIDIMQTYVGNAIGYLHSSPEYLMKRLLSKQIGDIYYLGHAFRKYEISKLHNPEFTIIEWYRKNITYKKFLNEVIACIRLFLPKVKFTKLSYEEALFKYTNIHYLDDKALKKFAKRFANIENWDKDEIVSLIMSKIEKKFGENELFILDKYPPSQAALAKVTNGYAERFEVFYKGIELANGFHELTCEKTQRQRFIAANKKRISNKKNAFELDEKFLACLSNIQDCWGVAVGFDRLLMLQLNKKNIKDVLSFSWDET